MATRQQQLLQCFRAGLCGAAMVFLAGCATSSSTGVAVVNIERITAHWDKFSDYERQLRDESQRITASGTNEDDRRRRLQALHDKYAALQSEITTDVRQASDRVAQAQGLHLIVTREFVGYGGADITSDVEHELKIVETPSPIPTVLPVPTAMPIFTAAPTPAASQTPSMPLKPPVH